MSQPALHSQVHFSRYSECLLMKETGLHVIVQAFLSEHVCHASVESLPHARLLNQTTTQDCNCCFSEGFVSLAATWITVLTHCATSAVMYCSQDLMFSDLMLFRGVACHLAKPEACVLIATPCTLQSLSLQQGWRLQGVFRSFWSS